MYTMGIPSKLVTMETITGAAPSLSLISPSNNQQPPAVTHQPVGEYTFFHTSKRLTGVSSTGLAACVTEAFAIFNFDNEDPVI